MHLRPAREGGAARKIRPSCARAHLFGRDGVEATGGCGSIGRCPADRVAVDVPVGVVVPVPANHATMRERRPPASSQPLSRADGAKARAEDTVRSPVFDGGDCLRAGVWLLVAFPTAGCLAAEGVRAEGDILID